MSSIEHYYDEDPVREWERLERHRTEFAVTLRALAEYLPPPPASIIDIGGGPGRYAIALARQGYRVTLVDLSAQNLAFAQEKAAEAGVEIAAYVHADARDLTQFADATFDAALLLGPLYHLHALADRQRALAESRRLLKAAGVLYAAWITRYAAIRDAARRSPGWIVAERERVEMILAAGVSIADDDEHSPIGHDHFTDAYFAHPTEIAPSSASGGFTPLDLVACEGVISMIEDQVNQLTGDLWDEWVAMNYRLAHDPSVHGGAEHLLYVGRKA